MRLGATKLCCSKAIGENELREKVSLSVTEEAVRPAVVRLLTKSILFQLAIKSGLPD